MSALCLILLAGMGEARAVEPVDRFSFRAGGYLSRLNMDVRAAGENDAGTAIDLRRDLGLKPSQVIGNFGEDQLYEAAATVAAGYDLDVYHVSYTWWTAARERWALGPQAGLVWYRLRMFLRLDLDVDGNAVGESVENSVSADLPTPSLGVRWAWTPARSWRLSAEAGYFSLDLNGVDADVTYGRAVAEWHPRRGRVGIWMDYVANDVSARSDRRDFSGSAGILDTGLRLGVMYRH